MQKLKTAAATSATAAATATSTALKARHDAAIGDLAAEIAAVRRENARVGSELESAYLRASSAEARAAECAQQLADKCAEIEALKIKLTAAEQQADSAAVQIEIVDQSKQCESLEASLAELTAKNEKLTERLKLKHQECDTLDMHASRMQVDAAEAARRADELELAVDSLRAKIAEMEQGPSRQGSLRGTKIISSFSVAAMHNISSF